MAMLPSKSRASKILTRINAKLMRKPTVIIIPTDNANAIYKRKQELQPDEINRYYNDLHNILENHDQSSIHKIAVANKSPEDLAIEATNKILQSLEPVIFQAISVYEKDLKRK